MKHLNTVSKIALLSSFLCVSACEDEDMNDVSSGTGTTTQTGTDTLSSTATTSATDSTTSTETTTDTNTGTSTGTDSTNDAVLPGYPTLAQGCTPAVAAPTRLAVTSTNGSVGEVGWVDMATKTLYPSLAVVHNDTSMSARDGLVYVLNRLGSDRIDVFNPATGFTLQTQFALRQADEADVNPYDVVTGPDGRLFVSQFERAQLAIYSPLASGAPTHVGDVDLSAFSDGDMLPEMGDMVDCGTVAFVSSEPLDRENGWTPSGPVRMIPVDLTQGKLFDFVGSDNLPDGIELPGRGYGKTLLDPTDPTQHTVLVGRNPGLSRVNLATGEVSQAVEPSTLEAKGISVFQQQDWALGSDNDTLWISAASADWSEFGIWRGSLSDGGASLVQVLSGLQTTTGSLFVNSNELWYPDTNPDGAGLRVFDISGELPVEVAGSPFSMGLAPYTFVGF